MKWRLKRCLSGLWKFRELTKEETMNKKELNKIDKKERSGIPVDMHMIQHQHLQQYQSDKPLYSL